MKIPFRLPSWRPWSPLTLSRPVPSASLGPSSVPSAPWPVSPPCSPCGPWEPCLTLGPAAQNDVMSVWHVRFCDTKWQHIFMTCQVLWHRMMSCPYDLSGILWPKIMSCLYDKSGSVIQNNDVSLWHVRCSVTQNDVLSLWQVRFCDTEQWRVFMTCQVFCDTEWCPVFMTSQVLWHRMMSSLYERSGSVIQNNFMSLRLSVKHRSLYDMSSPPRTQNDSSPKWNVLQNDNSSFYGFPKHFKHYSVANLFNQNHLDFSGKYSAMLKLTHIHILREISRGATAIT